MCALPKLADWSEVNDPTEAPEPLTPPDYEHIPACLWPPDGCLVELPVLWHLTGRRIEFPNGCCITHTRPMQRNGWKVYTITVDAGQLPDLKTLVDNVHQWHTAWDDQAFSPVLKIDPTQPDTYILEVW